MSYSIEVPNLWYRLLQDNKHLFSDKNKTNADYYKSTMVAKIKTRRNFSNFFSLDGRSYEHIIELIQELYDKKDRVVLTNILKQEEPTTIFNDGEGHGPHEFFDAIHMLVEICNLKGEVVYENASVNISEIYEDYCKERMILPKMSVRYSGNVAFFNPSNPHYNLPKVININELDYANKKFVCSFNWNPWVHRLGLIALLHYYDLIDEGYVTSPGTFKYGYNPERDFRALTDCIEWYLKWLPEYKDVMEKLPSLQPKFPLKVDDRSKYVDTDTPIIDTTLKMPIYQARVNSLFEIVAETRFVKEHFFSEKTFWPIKIGRPFLMISGSGSLESLKKLGFKTFSPLIDESYDQEDNIPLKTKKIVLELVRLKNLRQNNPIEFDNLYKQLQEITSYNSEVFKNKHVDLL
jgi:hypothetical protein